MAMSPEAKLRKDARTRAWHAANKEWRRAYSQRYERANAARRREYKAKKRRHFYLKRTYGISEAEFDAQVARQDGRCAICRHKPRGTRGTDRLYVDHDHVDQRRRELICFRCNSALGMVREDPAIALALARYLHKHTPARYRDHAGDDDYALSGG